MKKTVFNSSVSIIRIFIKTVLLLCIINFGWIMVSKLPIGKFSFYNFIFDGRLRLPFGENPKNSYNLSLYNIDALFASHVIDSKHAVEDGDIKVILIGDSSIWGFLQKPNQTLSSLLEKEFINRGQDISFYNLGYPSISILKDLMLIEKTFEYKPDLIIWFTTLEALPKNIQLDIPLVENNPEIVNKLIDKYELVGVQNINENILHNTFWNQRRNISDQIDLQLYGVLWSATGIDQEYPIDYQIAQRDFNIPNENFHGLSSHEDLADHLELEIFKKVIEGNLDTDFVIVNEPILVSSGVNSSLQYNFYYPRWAYDQYRKIMDGFTKENQITYYDFWEIIPENEFTNSAIHLSIDGENIFAKEMEIIVENYLKQKGVND